MTTPRAIQPGAFVFCPTVRHPPVTDVRGDA